MDFSQLFEVARGLGDRYRHLVNLVDGLKHARGVKLLGSLVQELHEAGLGEVLAGADALKIDKNGVKKINLKTLGRNPRSDRDLCEKGNKSQKRNKSLKKEIIVLK